LFSLFINPYKPNCKKKGRARDLPSVEAWQMKTCWALRMEGEGKKMRGKIEREERKKMKRHDHKKKMMISFEIRDSVILIEAFY
jgi:hypothetical protein